VETIPREIRIYETADGRAPFLEWMDTLEGQDIYEVIMLRLDRVERGNLGDNHSVGNGVSEPVIDEGPGYRIYFGQVGMRGEMIVILSGAPKKTKKAQTADIHLAKKYWEDFNHA
jgi:putative addiction module killer protein